MPFGYEGTSWSVKELDSSWRVYSILSGAWSTSTSRGIVKTVTTDSNMARSAADGMLDFAVDGIITGVTTNLTDSPDLVVALVAGENEHHGRKTN